MDNIKIAIAGGAGYTAGELIRILIKHPNADIKYIASNSHYHKRVDSVHQDLFGECNYIFCDIDFSDIDLIFLCLGHGNSRKYLEEHDIPESVKIIDLSNDFRLKESSEGFIYGLPEQNREKIKTAQKIANPGCFATSIELALLPLASESLIQSEVNIHGITGSTGAGQAATKTTHYSWRESNLSTYKEFTHQHLAEISETIDSNRELLFVPIRGNHTRGIFSTITLKCDKTEEQIKELYYRYYNDHPFTYISEDDINMKQVVNSNKCLLHIRKHNNTVLITSTIDNLIKGASGQAIHNMNLMYGLPESTGLRLKGVGF